MSILNEIDFGDFVEKYIVVDRVSKRVIGSGPSRDEALVAANKTVRSLDVIIVHVSSNETTFSPSGKVKTEESIILYEIARILHSHWGEGVWESYVPSQLPILVRELVQERDRLRKEIESHIRNL